MHNHWSKSEVTAAVDTYFKMLQLELSCQKYNKTDHRKKLQKQLNNRSDGSIELKNQNISAVLIEMGIPYVEGYKPRFNYQRSLLPDVVSDYLRTNPKIQELFETDSLSTPSVPGVEDFLATMEDPPELEKKIASAVAEPRAIYNPAGVNYLEREARNRSLGEAGEQFVINFERTRLIHMGKEKLANRIEQVSVTIGPSAGFDIHSFESNGSDRYIEAKTTKYGKNTPFFVTPNELKFSRTHSSHYFLYRIFKFRKNPRIFTLHGLLEDRCIIEPTEFLARLA
ncbi:MAG: DUF3883 domain-containing protein [Desulfomicrobium apsheronum]|nr:DUF3883 domain-containing protein [Desulfomicrobium apsheronum]